MRLTHIILALMSVIAMNSADLRSDLRDFINLVPKGRIAMLAGRHFLFDARFRAAFNYLRSSHFEALVRDDISNNQEVQDIIDYLERDIDLNVIPRIIRRVVIRLRPAQEYSRVRTVTSFVREVADILPDDQFADLIRQKSAADPEFADLYEKITDPEFKSLVYKAKNSESLTGVFQTLRNHQVEVDQILEIFFQKLDKLIQLTL